MTNSLIPIRLSFLNHYQGILPVDVYLERHPGKYTRIHKQGEVYDGEQLVHFEAKADGELLIDETQISLFNNFLAEVLKHAVISPEQLKKEEMVEIMALGLGLTFNSIIEQNDELSSNLENAQIHVKSCLRLIAEDIHAGVQIYLAIAENEELLKHSFHVMLLSLSIAKKAGFASEKALASIGLGALLHDIGHSRIDEEIFRKVRLTPKEWEMVKDHPHLGLKMVDLYKGLTQEVRSIILQHHEYCNGRGYPNRLTQTQIYPPARLVSVADVFSSLIVKSNYRPVKYTSEEALDLMKSELGHFDMNYLEILESIVVSAKKRAVA